MRKKILNVATFVLLLVGASEMQAQVSTPLNSGNPTDYVGWDVNQNFPLQIRHNGNQNISFFTNSTLRATYTNFGSYQWQSCNATGFRSFAFGLGTTAGALFNFS